MNQSDYERQMAALKFKQEQRTEAQVKRYRKDRAELAARVQSAKEPQLSFTKFVAGMLIWLTIALGIVILTALILFLQSIGWL